MSKTDILEELIKKNNGYLITAQAMKKGVSKTFISDFVKEKEMERLARGVYITEDAWPDYLYVIHLRNKEAVFSHESALAMHGLMDCEAPGINITVNRTYNATHLRKEGCTVYTVSPELYDMGLTEGTTMFGNKVTMYDMDRTICDIIKHKKRIELQTYQNAVKGYMKSPKKNLNNLMRYAKALGVEDTVRLYTEVML